ncbi:MAG: flagellar hook-associated protein 3 [Nitrospinae bacterium CG11_big_fil_rev_8_21_14_0_20_56_8]|nr:MAG: flagellar hook-associated protein 3 [Nitrospinae bacterium CG11_big_fil_rev_8_21_14_0_20_56_8]
MVSRVTDQAIQANVTRNIFRITEGLFEAQKQIASGKRLSRPSDDPTGIRDSLSFRTSIKKQNQFIRNIDNNRIFLQRADTALNAVGITLSRAKELAIQGVSGSGTAVTRGFAADELDKLISQVLQEANTQVKDNYIFAGTKTRTIPFSASASGVVYQGNSSRFSIEVAKDVPLDIAIPGSEILATDLNPTVSNATALSALNSGSGITAGSFSITDRAGNSATVTVTAGQTVGDAINAINAAGINVTASLNSSQNALLLTDTSAVIAQGLTVAEVGGGSTASSLGILGSRDGNFEGRDLDPSLTASTLLSQLNGGSGPTLTSIRVVNGAASGVVSLSAATTIGDVLNAINAAGLNVTAGVNSAGNALRVVSNSSSTVAVVNEIGTGTTAEDLGLGGGRNVLDTLITLRNALRANDSIAVLTSFANIDSSLDAINESRAVFGAIQGRLESTSTVHEQDIVDQNQQLSDIEDADVVEQASTVANLEVALQATLSATARIVQPTLVDFLR